MIIIRLRSGLGNQMFQYAFFKQMQQWHGEEKVKLDSTTFHWRDHGGLEIDSVFGIDLKKDSIPASVALKYADVGHKFHHRILRRIRGTRHHSYAFWKNLKFEDYKELDNIYIEGYWNNEKYFEGVKDQIRELYKFNSDLNDSDKSNLQKISSSQSVSVHVRRGDYRKYPETFPMCTQDYYKKAINILSKEFIRLKCFVFSDDIPWCKEELSFLPQVEFIENQNKKQAYKDMMLMSRCKHNIIANSTFSWWAAWLNNNPEKIVIYPKSTLLTHTSMPRGWIKL